MTQVGVLIAAKDAVATIGRAVASALAQDAVSEVIVVDDGSTDDTAAAARCRDDGTGRLRIDILPRNAGPAAARNRAIEVSGAPVLGVLDADDYFLPGRVTTLLAAAGTDWDLAADGLILVRDGQSIADGMRRDYRAQVGHDHLAAEAFIEGSMPRDRPRHELAFMKPLIRRAFLDRIGLRYDQKLRLGEDFALYAAALLRGARFVLTPGCGYVAAWRDASISGCHAAQDLFDFSHATLGLMASAATPAQRLALLRHARNTALRASYHRALELKQQGKLTALAGFLASNLGSIPYMLRATAQPRTGGGAA